MLRLLFCLLILTLFHGKAYAECQIPSPYKGGTYANEMLDFVAGHWIKLRGEEAQDWGKTYRKPTSLHPSRLINPAMKVLGCPKESLETSLTLGHAGYVIVGPGQCFRNGKGPDILIHEPRTDLNTNETFNVYITADEAGKGPWYKIAANTTVARHNNYLEVELDGILSPKGYPMTEFRWIKIEDADSKIVLSNKLFSGFDVSAVKFMFPCDLPVS